MANHTTGWTNICMEEGQPWTAAQSWITKTTRTHLCYIISEYRLPRERAPPLSDSWLTLIPDRNQVVTTSSYLWHISTDPPPALSTCDLVLPPKLRLHHVLQPPTGLRNVCYHQAYIWGVGGRRWKEEEERQKACSHKTFNSGKHTVHGLNFDTLDKQCITEQHGPWTKDYTQR